MTKDIGGPAFPQLTLEYGKRDGHGDIIEPFASSHGGMTLRQWYAGQAIVGLLANENLLTRLPTEEERIELMAGAAFEIADAMVAEGLKP